MDISGMGFQVQLGLWAPEVGTEGNLQEWW